MPSLFVQNSARANWKAVHVNAHFTPLAFDTAMHIHALLTDEFAHKFKENICIRKWVHWCSQFYPHVNMPQFLAD